MHPIIGEVWEFHRITNELSAAPWLIPYDVTPKRLELIIKEYLEKGHRFVSIDDMVDYVIGVRDIDIMRGKKWICITLDDGYMDNYENAYPIFKKYNVPFCVYVTTGYIDGNFEVRYGTPLSMTREQVKELAKEPLCTIAAHTVKHQHLPKLTEVEQKKEIENSVCALEKMTGEKILHFSVPYGDYSSITVQILRECGIKSSVSGWGGPIRKGVKYDPYFIPRCIIEERKKME